MLEQKGDPVCLMEQAVKDFESGHVKDQKKLFVEILKQINHDHLQTLSKTRQKKFETTALQTF